MMQEEDNARVQSDNETDGAPRQTSGKVIDSMMLFASWPS